jgi:hypothetical protein
MTRPLAARGRRLSLVLLVLTAVLASASAQDGLKTIDNPGGGQIVYDVVPNQTAQGAMGAVLRYAHGRFGDRPQIGTIFQSRDGQTFGASFTLTATKQGNKPIAGLVMVSMAMGTDPQAAVLYDEKARFARTQPEMLHTLSGIWSQQVQPAGAEGPSAPQGQPRPLHMVSGGDGSGHIGLPDDWHITAMSGGQCTAEGPNGELVGLGLMYGNIHDPSLRSNLQQFSGANQAGALAYRIGGNIYDAFVSLTNQVRRINRKPPATFTFISSKPVPGMNQNEHAVEVHFEVDFQDGKGPRTASARVGENFMQGSPTWMMDVQTSSIPKALYDREWPTVQAIIRSYNQDVGVINRELQTSLDNTRAIGARSRQQAADADSRRVASTAAFNQHMDDLSVASKVQQNYTMDRTELQDNNQNTRGAVDNNVAAALIKANPDRYQEVPSSSFLKGVDY